MKKVNVIKGEVVDLQKDYAMVETFIKLDNEEIDTELSFDKISFDFCLIATGSSYEYPFKNQKPNEGSYIRRLEQMTEYREKVKNASTFLIQGGYLLIFDIVV